MLKTLVVALPICLYSVSAGALDICALYCPPIDACSMTFSKDGGCHCDCKAAGFTSAADSATPSDDGPPLTLRLKAIDKSVATLVPVRPDAALQVPDLQASFNNPADGAGGGGPKTPKEEPLTPKEVLDALKQLATECKLRGGC